MALDVEAISNVWKDLKTSAWYDEVYERRVVLFRAAVPVYVWAESVSVCWLRVLDLQRALRFASQEEMVVRALICHLMLRTVSVHTFFMSIDMY